MWQIVTPVARFKAIISVVIPIWVMRARARVCMYVCMYVAMRVCMRICTYVCIYAAAAQGALRTVTNKLIYIRD
jgi:hypothetical protein